jgi:glycosyltransferase involved in cell wall biosynthesis
VDLSHEPDLDVSPYDIVHVFNIQRATMPLSLQMVVNAVRQHRRVALSTIYWNSEHLYAVRRELFGKRAQTWRDRAAQAVRQTTRFDLSASTLQPGSVVLARRASTPVSREASLVRDLQQATLLLADIWLPNTQAELALLKQEFGIASHKSHVIPNAVDIPDQLATPDLFASKFGWTGFVLCAARIEHRKNQIQLIRALKGAGLRLVLAGNDRVEPEYAAFCRKEASSDVLFTGRLEGEMLNSAFAAAKTHVLPSFFETPGIASLEAALYGCNIVITETGGTREYFGDMAWYCDPYDPATIRSAVLDAHAAEFDPALSARIRENFTWDKAALATLEAYAALGARQDTPAQSSK